MARRETMDELTVPETHDTDGGWVTARHLHIIAARLARSGHSLDALLERAGVPASVRADPDGRVSLTHVEAMLRVVASDRADPVMGLHLASEIEPAAFGALGFLFQSVTTFGDALDVITRYHGVLSNVGVATLTVGHETASFRWDARAGGPLFRRHASEYVLGMLGVLTRWIILDDASPMREVSFRHARPTEPWLLREYEELFRCPVHFDRPYSEVVFPKTTLARKQRFGDPALREVLEQRLSKLLEEHRQAVSPTASARRAITRAIIDGEESKESVARILGTSGRTLQRTLAAHGTSYRALRDEALLELARRRLSETDQPVDEVARHLRFGSHSAFLRWFKRASGETAGAYRKRARRPE